MNETRGGAGGGGMGGGPDRPRRPVTTPLPPSQRLPASGTPEAVRGRDPGASAGAGPVGARPPADLRTASRPARSEGGGTRPAAGRPAVSRPARARSRNAAAPIVPPQAVAGRALILVVAIMGFLACLAFGFLTLVSDAARSWQLDVSREVTIQVKPLDGVGLEARLQRAMAHAASTPGVRNVRLLSERESSALLEPWLGLGLDLGGLPVPRLVVLELEDPATADLAGLKVRLLRDVKGAVLDDHSVWAARLRTMAGTMVVAGWLVLTLVLTAMVLSVVFATRAAMAGNRDVIEVLHFVGAEDRFIAREFQQHFLLLGLKGGMVGGIAAMAAFALADWVTRETQGSAVSDQAQALFGGFSVGWTGYLGTAGIIALVAGLTALTSRLTVRSYLNQLD